MILGTKLTSSEYVTWYFRYHRIRMSDFTVLMKYKSILSQLKCESRFDVNTVIDYQCELEYRNIKYRL